MTILWLITRVHGLPAAARKCRTTFTTTRCTALPYTLGITFGAKTRRLNPFRWNLLRLSLSSFYKDFLVIHCQIKIIHLHLDLQMHIFVSQSALVDPSQMQFVKLNWFRAWIKPGKIAMCYHNYLVTTMLAWLYYRRHVTMGILSWLCYHSYIIIAILSPP